LKNRAGKGRGDKRSKEWQNERNVYEFLIAYQFIEGGKGGDFGRMSDPRKLKHRHGQTETPKIRIVRLRKKTPLDDKKARGRKRGGTITKAFRRTETRGRDWKQRRKRPASEGGGSRQTEVPKGREGGTDCTAPAHARQGKKDSAWSNENFAKGKTTRTGHCDDRSSGRFGVKNKEKSSKPHRARGRDCNTKGE